MLGLEETAAAQLPAWFTAGKRTPRVQVDRVRRGFHPFGAPLLEPAGPVCGQCAYARVYVRAGRYWKCTRYKLTHSEASDLRIRWPACNQFKPKTEDKA